jgi:hypothetical protein
MAGPATRSGAPAEHIGRSRSALASARATTRTRDVVGAGLARMPASQPCRCRAREHHVVAVDGRARVPMVSDHLVLKATA